MQEGVFQQFTQMFNGMMFLSIAMSVIFFVIFAIVMVKVFRTAGRARQFQNRIFDVVEQHLQSGNFTVHTGDSTTQSGAPSARNYACGQCGATLGDNADVSPSGDFKCTYCGKWSNIHS
jgi:hypothetical protein